MNSEYLDRIFDFIHKGGWPIATDTPLIVYVEDCDVNGSPIAETLDRFTDWRLLIDPITGALLSQHEATTMYGKAAIKQQKRIGGAARIIPGFHEDVWGVGFHKGRKDHPALIQKKPITIQRDLNGDGKRDGDKFYTGIFGLNQHTTGRLAPKLIGPHSLGCLVGRYRESHIDIFMKQIMESDRYKKFGKDARFSSFIFKSQDIVNQK